MPTGGGIVYPSPTDDPNVPQDLQAMAESIEAGLARISGAAFAVGTGWSLTSFSAKRVGAFVAVRVLVARTGAAITVGTSDAAQGVLSAVSALGTMPAGYIPSAVAGLNQAGNGRAGAGGYIDTSGVVTLQSIGAVPGASTPNVVTGTTISLGGVYLL